MKKELSYIDSVHRAGRIWNLSVMVILMLFPAELFPVIRLEDTPLRLTLVVFAYLCAITGMFGMFYPWRIRQLLAWIAASRTRVTATGFAAAATGALFIVSGFIA